MKFTKQEINKLSPEIRVKRTTIKGLGIVVEQRYEMIVFHFKYKSPVTFKPRHIKLAEANYGKLSANILNAVKDKANILNAQVVNDIASLLFQPVYHPWVNRIELVWKPLHDIVARNHRQATMKKLIEDVKIFMNNVSPFPGSMVQNQKI